MFQLNYLLAVTLLTAPVDASLPPRATQVLEGLRPTLQTLAIQWEILDPREVRYILARPEDFASDLNLVRRRYQSLADAPALSDCLRFPDRDAVNEMLSFNRAYRQHLGLRQPMELSRWWELRTALQETDHLYQVWDNVRDARCDYYYVTVRRQALKKLREMIGEEAYYSGHMPPSVPVWRFHQMD
jgi:hypothetical protein